MSYERSSRSRRTAYGRPGPPAHTSRHHSLLGYWVPLIVTGTIAIGGLAAWIWSERSESDEDEYPSDQKPPRPPPGAGAPYPIQGSQPYPGPLQGEQGGPAPPYAGPQGGPPSGPPGGEATSYYGEAQESRELHEQEDDQQTFFGQVRGAIRRTPSPQQFFDSASRQVSAGIAAAGTALGSIMEDPENGHAPYDEERREGFSDHERWSEEAEEKDKAGRSRVESSSVTRESERRADVARSGREGRAKKTVAVVVSADTNMDGRMDEDDVVYSEHASILSHLPPVHDPSKADLFILIYAPGLSRLPPLNYQPHIDAELASNLGSSYSQINTPAATTPGSELQSISPRIDPTTAAEDFPSPGRQFDALYQQALTLVSHPSQILCFTTIDGYVHILRHLAPQTVYVSDMLSRDDGEAIAQLKGWVGNTIIVAGDEGTGGLADTETEDEAAAPTEKRRWYEHSSLVGLGKIEVVDAARVGDDWARRVAGRE